MEERCSKTIEEIYTLVCEIKNEIEKSKMNWWKNPSNTNITVLKKLIEAEEKLKEMTSLFDKIKNKDKFADI